MARRPTPPPTATSNNTRNRQQLSNIRLLLLLIRYHNNNVQKFLKELSQINFENISHSRRVKRIHRRFTDCSKIERVWLIYRFIETAALQGQLNTALAFLKYNEGSLLQNLLTITDSQGKPQDPVNLFFLMTFESLDNKHREDGDRYPTELHHTNTLKLIDFILKTKVLHDFFFNEQNAPQTANKIITILITQTQFAAPNSSNFFSMTLDNHPELFDQFQSIDSNQLTSNMHLFIPTQLVEQNSAKNPKVFFTKFIAEMFRREKIRDWLTTNTQGHTTGVSLNLILDCFVRNFEGTADHVKKYFLECYSAIYQQIVNFHLLDHLSYYSGSPTAYYFNINLQFMHQHEMLHPEFNHLLASCILNPNQWKALTCDGEYLPVLKGTPEYRFAKYLKEVFDKLADNTACEHREVVSIAIKAYQQRFDDEALQTPTALFTEINTQLQQLEATGSSLAKNTAGIFSNASHPTLSQNLNPSHQPRRTSMI